MNQTNEAELLAVEKAHPGGEVEHTGFVPIKETFRGQTVWEGIVNVYDIYKHPTVKQAYAWSFKDDRGETRYVVVSQTPPVKDALTAVRAYIASLGRK